jgi:hypothetical protein
MCEGEEERLKFRPMSLRGRPHTFEICSFRTKIDGAKVEEFWP